MTALINECAKKHMSKHSRVSSYFQLDLDVFKRVFICHGKAVTTNAKRTLMKIGYDRWEKEELLKKTWEKFGKKRDIVPKH